MNLLTRNNRIEAASEFLKLVAGYNECTDRGGLEETPSRLVKAWEHWCGGYEIDVPSLFKTFSDGAPGRASQIVTVRDIPFYSHCEHHLAPFFGTATISYIAGDKIVGLSKLSRVVDAYARRLQVQERLTSQIGDAIYSGLSCQAVSVFVRARHMCMESRGVCQQGQTTETSFHCVEPGLNRGIKDHFSEQFTALIRSV